MSAQDIRLRLAIRRHGVPEIKLVWPCACSSDTTIAKLLTQVNEVVPLESSEWGLEDYAVELLDDKGGSYECLHFQLVSQILKDEDHVVIRSLLSDDIRRRRLSGRHQISTDGKHLVDGLAFGRPWLRTPRDRPAFELPPRKRARIEHQDMAEKEQEPEQLLLEGPPRPDEAPDGRLQSILVNGGGDLDDSEDQDDEFEPDQDTEQSVSGDGEDDVGVDYSPGALVEELRLLDEDEDSGNNQSASNEPTLEQLGVLRMAFPLLSFSTIEKELFRQKQNLRKTYDTLRRSTAPSLSFDDMMDRMVTGLLEQHESSPVQPVMPSLFRHSRPASKPLIEEVDSNGSDTSTSGSSYDGSSDPADDEHDEGDSGYEDTSDSPDESSDGDSDDSSDDSSSDSDESESEPQPGSKPVPEAPRPQKALVKSEGTAPHEGLSRTQKRNARRKRARLLGRQEEVGTPEFDDAELLARKEALLGALSEDASLETTSEPILANGKSTQTPENPRSETLPDSNDSAGRRARVDMGAGRRMLFGALGLKNPKSKADEERIREGLLKEVKVLHNPRIVQVVDSEDTEQPSEDNANPDAWQSKITYRAVECCHEGMVLSEPPFPFVQRWDPQQQYGSMRKRKRESQAYYDDSYAEEGSVVFGEEADAIDAKSNSKTKQSARRRDPFGAHVNGVEEAPTNGDGVGDVEVEDLPALPEDMGSLATLEKGGAKEGMVITWKQCIMSKATQWQPVIASVTGEVLSGSSESSLEVRLALRDREHKEKVFDEKGQRVYDKFEVPDFEEDEEEADDGHRTIGWGEMIEPKILQATSPRTEGARDE
ncbi:transcription factor atf21 [Metarhizium brunneum]